MTQRIESEEVRKIAQIKQDEEVLFIMEMIIFAQ